LTQEGGDHGRLAGGSSRSPLSDPVGDRKMAAARRGVAWGLSPGSPPREPDAQAQR